MLLIRKSMILLLDLRSEVSNKRDDKTAPYKRGGKRISKSFWTGTKETSKERLRVVKDSGGNNGTIRFGGGRKCIYQRYVKIFREDSTRPFTNSC